MWYQHMSQTSTIIHADGSNRRRRVRWSARRTLWTGSGLQRVRNCGRIPRSLSSGVAIMVRRDSTGNVIDSGYSGLQHCNSVWSCPVCAAQIASQRQMLVSEVLTRWHARGGRAMMITLTVRHDRTQSLKTVWDAVAKGWSRATNGRSWDVLGSLFGVDGRLPWLRFVEVTHGKSGWHVHVHALVLLGEGAQGREADVVEQIRARMWGSWNRAVVRQGLKSGLERLSEAHLIEPDAGDGLGGLAGYFAKAAFELTYAGATKAAQGDNCTPFEILRLLTGDLNGEVGLRLSGKERTRLWGIWHEWEESSSGRRQMGVSKGLFDMLGLDSSWTPSDDEIIEDNDLGGDELFVIGHEEWTVLLDRGLALDVLEAVAGDLEKQEAERVLVAALGLQPARAVIARLARDA